MRQRAQATLANQLNRTGNCTLDPGLSSLGQSALQNVMHSPVRRSQLIVQPGKLLQRNLAFQMLRLPGKLGAID
jgi:hypothetical protein